MVSPTALEAGGSGGLTSNAPSHMGKSSATASSTSTTTLFVIMILSILLIWSGLTQLYQADTRRGSLLFAPSASSSQMPTKIDVLRWIDEESPAGMNESAGDAVGGSPSATTEPGEGGADITISSSDSSVYVYPGSFTSVMGKKCVDSLWSHCNNGGADRCRWRQTACNFNNNDCYRLTEIFPNRTLLFRGDSTLREQFSVWSFYCCPWAAPVLKKDANMTYRETIARHHAGLGLKSFYHFDYMFDHLLEPVPNIPASLPIDAVVVGLGMYQAKAITTNQSDANSLDEIYEKKLDNVVKSVCDFHKAKVGFFVGGWMECSAMRKHKAKTVRQNARVCSASAAIVSTINKMARHRLSLQKPRKDGCYVHYIPAMKCRGQRHTCTGDGVHARSGGAYGNTKFQLLFNAAKILFQTAPPGR